MGFWTVEEIEQVRAAAEVDGLSAAQIAKRFDRSRNSVIGVIHRNDIVLKRSTGSWEISGEGLRAKRRKKKPRGLPKKEPELSSFSPQTTHSLSQYANLFWRENDPELVSLMDRKEGQCCWPIDTPQGHMYCGRQTSGTYCDFHAKAMVRRDFTVGDEAVD